MDLLTYLSNIPLCGRPCVRLSPVWGPQSNDNLNAKLLARPGQVTLLFSLVFAKQLLISSSLWGHHSAVEIILLIEFHNFGSELTS